MRARCDWVHSGASGGFVRVRVRGAPIQRKTKFTAKRIKEVTIHVRRSGHLHVFGDARLHYHNYQRLCVESALSFVADFFPETIVLLGPTAKTCMHPAPKLTLAFEY